MTRGFTLVEMLIVFGIIALLMGLTFLFGRETLARFELNRARDLLRQELLTAQSDSMTGKNNASWGVQIAPGAFTRFQGSSFSARNPDFDFVTSFSSTITVSGPSEIVFSPPRGLPLSSETLTLTLGQQTRTVMVHSSGLIESF
ncbi:prepilin-type N-terminal cleavage/methylation domain-containing protein [Candidatus Uhrbacteria bacterium]|nr:prepilin-type N-terminal cleavage/methylation domain-containing protein [Candidatus Uhrbacteria bacterium]